MAWRDIDVHSARRSLQGKVVRTPDEVLQPGGHPIGVAGSDPTIREVLGGVTAATDLFNELTQGGRDITPSGHPGKLVELPTGGIVGYRPMSKSGPPTIDVNIPGIPIRKIKFK
jgi:hypothetical protein